MRMEVRDLGQEEWKEKGYKMPSYDVRQMRKMTNLYPVWVHFGAGNIFRAFHAAAAQKLLDKGLMQSGITVCEGFDYEIVEKMYWMHDDLGVAVTLCADGSVKKEVIASVGEACILDSENIAQINRLRGIFQAKTLQMATFTITEKGYALNGPDGKLFKQIEDDIAAGPGSPSSYLGKVTSLLYYRFSSGAFPIAMVSTDNCSHNGEKLFYAVKTIAEGWTENGKAEAGFLDYITNPEKVSFPWTMIDKITPRPDEDVEKMLREDGVEDLEPVITSKKTYVAPFVNAEETEYLVVEDAFPNGRPKLEEAGVIFTDRETVNRTERMKVCTCLNPLHTSLAVFGCLLGYTKISDEMQDKDLVKLIREIGYKEGLPVVTDPKVLSPKEFLDTVLEVRLPNPFLPDSPQRIATDTSQKLAIRFGETIKEYMASDTLKVQELCGISLVLAGWIRYLLAVDDEGNSFDLSPDPRLLELKPYVSGISLGNIEGVEEKIRPLLEDATIFGVNLYEAGLAEMVLENLKKLLEGKGAVRKTLREF